MWDIERIDSVGKTKDNEYRRWAVMIHGIYGQPVPGLYEYEEFYVCGNNTFIIIARPENEREDEIISLLYKCKTMYDIHKLHGIKEYTNKLELKYYGKQDLFLKYKKI
jgi:hypothetical protein